MSIARKVLVIVGGSLALMLGSLGVVVVRSTASSTREGVVAEARQLVTGDAKRIEWFFAERARVVTTMLTSPQLREWFEGYDEYRAPLAEKPGYRWVEGYFRALVEQDPMLDEAFFAVASTGEYFKSEGRIEREGYSVFTRDWWHEALAVDGLYVASPMRSATTGKLLVTIQTTVNRRDGSGLLGVGGIDVLLSTVEEIVAGVRFRDRGRAFLVDARDRIIAFGGLEDLELDTPLAAMDQRPEWSGFGALVRGGLHNVDELDRVVVDGETMLVFTAPIRHQSPLMEWTLGLLVPEAVISAPFRRAAAVSALLVVLVIGVVSAVTLLIISTVVSRPVGRLAERFRDIAEGEADLTRRVEADSGDEIGSLGASFNTFVSAIRKTVAAVAQRSEALSGASQRLTGLSTEMAESVEKTSSRAETVRSAVGHVNEGVQIAATAADSMSATIQEIAGNVSEAARVARRAVDLGADASASFAELDRASSRITHVVKVINDVAEQTNLLALNATIEASRAGEAGRGFAVVAQEVKQLATETAAATREISSILGDVQSRARVAGEGIAQISEILGRISEIQTAVAAAVEEQTVSTREIARNVAEAATGSGEIARSIVEVAENGLVSKRAAESTREAARELAALAQELGEIVKRFTY